MGVGVFEQDPCFQYGTFYDLDLVDTVADLVFIGERGIDADLAELEEIKRDIAILKYQVFERETATVSTERASTGAGTEVNNPKS